MIILYIIKFIEYNIKYTVKNNTGRLDSPKFFARESV